MNIVREDIDALNAVLTVEVKPEDYQENVKTTLNKYRKTAKIPGFRPGHIPRVRQSLFGKTVQLYFLKN